MILDSRANCNYKFLFCNHCYEEDPPSRGIYCKAGFLLPLLEFSCGKASCWTCCLAAEHPLASEDYDSRVYDSNEPFSEGMVVKSFWAETFTVLLFLGRDTQK